MTKELEALDRNMVVIREKDYAIIEKALQRLKQIDNANPSEALECLEEIKQECKSTYFDENGKQWWTTDKNKDYRCNTIKQALLKQQEQEKVLEILERKPIDLWFINGSGAECIYSDYIIKCQAYMVESNLILTQEEFDTLKRWLE